MNCTCLAVAAIAALVATPLAAQPITRTCAYKGQGKLGPLTIAFDEAAHSVRVTTQDGRTYHYQDGVTDEIGSPNEDDLGPVEQFVKVLPNDDEVEVGFRWVDDGSTGHLAYFDRAAFKDLSKPCTWRSLWTFATG